MTELSDMQFRISRYIKEAVSKLAIKKDDNYMVIKNRGDTNMTYNSLDDYITIKYNELKNINTFEKRKVLSGQNILIDFD